MAQAATETINGKAGAGARGVTTIREAAFELFRARGMTTIFGNPGSTELPMLADFPSDFTYVLGLQEAVVVGMADGFSQASGQLTHVNLHTAPGVGNAVGAIFNAQANKSPLLITAGQQVRAQMTMQANLTNRDATRVPDPFVKWSYEPPRAQDVPAALARGIYHASLPPKGPVFVSLPMDDWNVEIEYADVRHALERSVTGRAAGDPEAVRALAARLEAARNPVMVAGPDVDASGAWDTAVALAERCRLPVWASPAPGGGRLGFPEGHPNFRGVLPPAIGPVGQTLEEHDFVLVAGSSVFPYYPYIPGPPLPEGAELVMITSDPDEAARAPVGDAIVADVKLTLEALLASVGESDRPPPEPADDPPPVEDSDPLSPSAVHGTLAEVIPEDGIVVLESPTSTLALRNRLRISRPGSYFFCAGGGLGLWARGRDRSAAGSAVEARGVRARRGLRAVRDHRLLDGGRLQGARHVPGAAERGVRDPEVVRRHRAGDRRTGPRPARARDRRRGPRLRRELAARARPGRAPRGARRRARLERAGAGGGGRGARHGPVLVRARLTSLAPPPVEASDRVPAELATGTPEPLRGELEALLGPDRVLPRVLDLVRYASDASPYRLLPRAVVMAQGPEDVAKVLAFGRRAGIPVTLRSGGTSLNGQAQGDGIMVDVRRNFRGFRVMDEGASVRVKPGTVLGHPNRALARYGRRLGPDPASTDFATVGGVIANNSGGMRCGVRHDSYSTLRSLQFVLPSGTLIDTSAPGAAERFAAEEPELARGLADIRDEIRADPELAERIRRKFQIKNTNGYRLCAFLDADEPVEIFKRLLVGSEGTLAFIAEAVLDTVPHGRVTSNALLFFSDIDAAAVPVPALVEAGASAVELMVNPTLIAASYSLPGVPERWREIPPEGAVLLVELRTDDAAELDEMEQRALAAVAGCELLEAARFTRDPEEVEVFWRVREGMQGIVGTLRPQGSALIIEDVCVPPPRIAESARDIQALLGEHEFLTGVAGHASAGNLHFLLTPVLSEPADRERYESFMAGLVELVVDKYDGSLKAEHGTGRNMAPYLEREWGAKATEMMWRIKRLADPDGVLNPDVLLSRDPGVHLRHLKSTPPIEDVANANACIECGFCEPVCPSRDVTTTPRQRIVLRREMARQPEGSPVRAALVDQYAYDGDETCAADGSCRLACPVAIDTGKLIKDLRARAHGERAERRALRLAKRWGDRGARRAGWASRRRPDRADRGRRGGAGTEPRRAPAGGRRAGARMEPRASPCGAVPPSHDLTRGRRRRIHARLHQPHLRHLSARRRRGAGCPTRSSTSPPARAGRCGSRPTHRATAAPPRGARRAFATAMRTWPHVWPMRFGAGATAARCRS